jgi:hypothetical protein
VGLPLNFDPARPMAGPLPVIFFILTVIVISSHQRQRCSLKQAFDAPELHVLNENETVKGALQKTTFRQAAHYPSARAAVYHNF